MRLTDVASPVSPQLSRLTGWLTAMPYGKRYTPEGEPTATHTSWCTALAIASTTLRSAGIRSGSEVLAQVVELVSALFPQLQAGAQGGDASLEGAREQHLALQLLEEIGRHAGAQVGVLKLLPLLSATVQSVAASLLQASHELQRAMPPTSAQERELATLLPSGTPLPQMGSRAALKTAAGSSGVPDTAYRARLSTALQGSLQSSLGGLGLPDVRRGYALSDVGEETLTIALRAALRSLAGPFDGGALSRRSDKALEFGARSGMLRCAQACLAIYGDFTVQAASNQLNQLLASKALADAHDRACRSSAAGEKGNAVREDLLHHARELERLPRALQQWVEAAMNEEGIEDASTRKAVLGALTEVELAARRGMSEVERAVMSAS